VRITLSLMVSVTISGCFSGAQLTPKADDGWPAPIANRCNADTDCADGSYCSFTVSPCAYDGSGLYFGTLNQGSCLPNRDQTPCHTSDDCSEEAICFEAQEPITECTRDAPCDAGSCEIIPGPMQQDCAPIGCAVSYPPHSRSYPCICPRNYCPGAGGLTGCVITLVDSWTDFGSVAVGATATRTLKIYDTGTQACFLTGLTLVPQCSSAFSLPNGPIVAQHLSVVGVGGTFPISVDFVIAFTPPTVGTFTCALDLEGLGGPSFSGEGVE
jgi:hypothetical protein